MFARLLVAVLKVLLREPRPDFGQLPELVMAPRSWSYPSGHAMMSMVVLGAAAMQIGHAAWFAVLIAGIGFSRLYLGVHWLNDVIGGYLWGAAVLACAWRLQRPWDRPVPPPAGRLPAAPPMRVWGSTRSLPAPPRSRQNAEHAVLDESGR